VKVRGDLPSGCTWILDLPLGRPATVTEAHLSLLHRRLPDRSYQLVKQIRRFDNFRNLVIFGLRPFAQARRIRAGDNTWPILQGRELREVPKQVPISRGWRRDVIHNGLVLLDEGFDVDLASAD
jgi:hypothetical protein